MPQYAFDVELIGVIRTVADTLEAAQEAVEGIDSFTLEDLAERGLYLTELSTQAGDAVNLFEVDGFPLEE